MQSPPLLDFILLILEYLGGIETYLADNPPCDLFLILEYLGGIETLSLQSRV